MIYILFYQNKRLLEIINKLQISHTNGVFSEEQVRNWFLSLTEKCRSMIHLTVTASLQFVKNWMFKHLEHSIPNLLGFSVFAFMIITTLLS